MITLLFDERCTRCNLCVAACPTNVFDLRPGAPPQIARPQDCQTCYMCELYCQADALYVDPNAEVPVPVDPAEILESGHLGRFRRDSGWDEWGDDPRFTNEHWRMEHLFMRARSITP